MIDRIKITDENAHHRAVAWPALKARQQQVAAAAAGVPTRSNHDLRWHFASQAPSDPMADTDMFDDSFFDVHEVFGADDATAKRPTTAWSAAKTPAWLSQAAQAHWLPHAGAQEPSGQPQLNYNTVTANIYKEREKRASDKAMGVDAKEDAATRAITDWFAAEFPLSDVRPHVSDVLYGYI